MAKEANADIAIPLAETSKKLIRPAFDFIDTGSHCSYTLRHPHPCGPFSELNLRSR